MNRDIDIREHAVIIKFDRGHEEVESPSEELGHNVDGELIRSVIHKNKQGKITRITIQNV